eukprot:3263572-Amphidinium_carterae.1
MKAVFDACSMFHMLCLLVKYLQDKAFACNLPYIDKRKCVPSVNLYEPHLEPKGSLNKQVSFPYHAQ